MDKITKNPAITKCLNIESSPITFLVHTNPPFLSRNWKNTNFFVCCLRGRHVYPCYKNGTGRTLPHFLKMGLLCHLLKGLLCRLATSFVLFQNWQFITMNVIYFPSFFHGLAPLCQKLHPVM